MQDVMDIVKNVEGIYESDTAFSVLKDFERVPVSYTHLTLPTKA